MEIPVTWIIASSGQRRNMWAFNGPQRLRYSRADKLQEDPFAPRDQTVDLSGMTWKDFLPKPSTHVRLNSSSSKAWLKAEYQITSQERHYANRCCNQLFIILIDMYFPFMLTGWLIGFCSLNGQSQNQSYKLLFKLIGEDSSTRKLKIKVLKL